MAEFFPSHEREGKPYGFTCKDCPERGSWAIPADFVSYTTTQNTKGRETLFLGLPSRCKSCNAAHATYKRAREAIERLYFIKPVNAGWEYLKFVTITRKMELVENSTPTPEQIKEFKQWYVRGRDKLRLKLNLLAGTDVLEIVTKKKGHLYHHHMHIHGIWVMPYMPVNTWRFWFNRVGFGRDHIRAIKETKWVDSEGIEHTTSPIKNCIRYLSKYITKAPDGRRMMWGEVRRWKDHMESDAPKHRIKSIRHYQQWKHDTFQENGSVLN